MNTFDAIANKVYVSIGYGWHYFVLHWREWLLYVKPIFIVVDVLLIIATAILWKVSWKYRITLSYRPYIGKKKQFIEHRAFERQWKKIEKRLSDGTLDSLRLAVIEADKLADDTLKQMKLKGEHMADRLQQLTTDELKSLDGLWKAHRTRNDLVHTPGFALSLEEAQATMKQYEAFFKEIGVLVPVEKKKKKEEKEEGAHGAHGGGHDKKDGDKKGHGKKGHEEEVADDYWG